MPIQRIARVNRVFLAVGAVVAVAAVVFLVPSIRERVVPSWFEQTARGDDATDRGEAPKLIFEKDTPGIRLSKQAVEGLQVTVQPAVKAVKMRQLTPQAGTVNFDIDGLFPVPSRFTGEVVEMAQVDDEAGPSGDIKKRPLRYGDRVKQGQLLAVVFSQPLGAQKAALVDAINNLRLSQEKLERQRDLYKQGALAVATLKDSELKVDLDANAVRTAERSLYLWKLSKEEVQAIKEEANDLRDQKVLRDAEAEAKRWGRVEIRVPVFDSKDKDRELVIVEKNTSVGAMVDPINTLTPLFRVADMNRLQIWAHPPEEYLPLLRSTLDHPERGPPRWDVRFQTDPADKPPLVLDYFMIAPSLEPFNHSPMVIGYLGNPKGAEHLVGQFVTVTLYVAPEPDTVEISTDALNEVNGESLVFVQPDPAKPEYFQRRVVVVARFKDKSFVRSKLTVKDEEQSKQEVEKGRHPLEPLQGGERVVGRGVLEMTACLEDLLSNAGKN
jgi:membrane fusion protein, heavy metal efflux system